jgi:predicted alpha/beta hydrolase
MTGVLDWVANRFPELPRFALGHSAGGQLIGLMPNHHLLTGMVTVASSFGYWGSFPAPFKYFCASIWYGYVPLMAALKGYVPTKSIGFGEALPRGVASE